MSDLQVGVQILGYAERVAEIIQVLSDATQAAQAAAGAFAGDEGGVYDGRARAEMKAFFESYAANLDKLIFFESAAEQFLAKVFDSFDFDDKDLAAVVAMWMGDQ